MIARDCLNVVKNRVSALRAPDGVQNRLVIRKHDIRHVLLVLVQQLYYHKLCELLERLRWLERAFQKSWLVFYTLVQSAYKILKRNLFFDGQWIFQDQRLQIQAVFAYFLAHYVWSGLYKCAFVNRV